ncbi:DinB family protein [Streptomyces polyrhachis]|uniref:DinB family protein n=1 Tax=Streptomyces polyrhachis TaxID=1282885 RepID=A0ABW2GG76_9ACTN
MITPDTKDWTWVLQRPCEECGFDASAVPREQVADLLRRTAPLWEEVLTRPDVRRRPRADVWSPLEYACHVRDVHDVYARRLHLMLTEDNPHYPNWDQDATAVAEDYAAQDPATVARALTANAHHLADAFAKVTGDQWARTGLRSDGASFTVETFARYFIHDPLHHLHDVGAPLP